MKKNKNKKEIEKLGMYIAFVLRHQPEAIGLQLDSRGRASVSELIEKSGIHGNEFTLDDLRKVVATDSKGRYAFDDGEKLIRAHQGHSFPVDLGLENKVPPAILYHGTATRFVQSILDTGLSKQKRHAVHLSESVTTAVSVGSRYGEPVILKINADAMNKDGYNFQCSENGVWLTEHVPTQYISLCK